jgi:hypothetical protein
MLFYKHTPKKLNYPEKIHKIGTHLHVAYACPNKMAVSECKLELYSSLPVTKDLKIRTAIAIGSRISWLKAEAVRGSRRRGGRWKAAESVNIYAFIVSTISAISQTAPPSLPLWGPLESFDAN